MRREDVEHALDALASDAPAPSADAASLIARGRSRIVRQRLVVIGVALAVIATAAGVGAVAKKGHTRRVVAPVPTTIPAAAGPARQIAVASSLEAWKCLDPMQYTNDGGRSWRTVAFPPGPRPASADALLCSAVAGGNAWAIWQTSDFAESYLLSIRGVTHARVVQLPEQGHSLFPYAPTFVDANHGWLPRGQSDRPGGSGFTSSLLRTSDGGERWAPAGPRPPFSPVSDFTDTEHGWAVTSGELAKTSDGGATWKRVAINLPRNVATADETLERVFARGSSIIVWGTQRFVGSGYDNFRVFFDVSGDGGQSWERRSGPEQALSNNDNNLVDAADGSNWVVASGQRLWRTDIGGLTWQRLPDVAGPASIETMAFPTRDIGWITTQIGAVLRTTDGGLTWTDVTGGATPQSTSTTTPPTGSQTVMPAQLAFPARTEGWICGTRVSYSTSDFDPYRGGSTGVDIPPNPSAVSGDYPQEPLCAAAPGGNFWMVRDSANESLSEIVHVTIRSTGDETSVSPFNTSPFGRIEALDFVDANHGWAIVVYKSAPLRTLYTTQDGGVNWSAFQNAPIGNGLEFADTTHGWASGYALPTLATTADGGHTWRTVAVPTPHGATQFAPVVPALVRGNVVITYGAWDTDTGTQLRPFFDVSTDSGRTWSLRSGPEGVTVPGGTATRIFSAADADHWALGSANRLYVTDNGGRTWTERAQFAGLSTISYVARPSANAMFVSGTGDPSGRSTVVLGTVDRGENWTTVESDELPLPSGGRSAVPGGIFGCPTQTITPAEPGDPPPGLVEAAFSYIRAQGFWEPDAASAVYKVGDNKTGVFGELFSFQLSRCPADSIANSWVVELYGRSGSGGGGSTPSAEVVLAHYADGWHVFGRYH
jgi:photosystem II stability/assembly factor-like uncharacterized protein